jgi:hypothetical protein
VRGEALEGMGEEGGAGAAAHKRGVDAHTLFRAAAQHAANLAT